MLVAGCLLIGSREEGRGKEGLEVGGMGGVEEEQELEEEEVRLSRRREREAPDDPLPVARGGTKMRSPYRDEIEGNT